MCHLAETAGRFILTVCMKVGRDLKQKNEREKSKSECKRLGESAQEWMRYNQHFCASHRESRSGLCWSKDQHRSPIHFRLRRTALQVENEALIQDHYKDF
jgi:hypothetical protein